MSLPIFTLATKYIKSRHVKLIAVVMTLTFPVFVHADWNVDFTRRSDSSKSQNLQPDAATRSVSQTQDKNMFDRLFDSVAPTQEIVILNTEQGFIPSTVRVKEGAEYKIVVVNVNEKSRNVSFVLDAFSEHHATFFGQIKSFNISPKKEGVYSFVSPETSAQGRLVVLPGHNMGPDNSKLNLRTPASE